MATCVVCGRRRHNKNMAKLAVPVEFVVNYATGERKNYPAGTLVCSSEWRKMGSICGTTSEGQQIHWRNGKWRRDDGKEIYETGVAH